MVTVVDGAGAATPRVDVPGRHRALDRRLVMVAVALAGRAVEVASIREALRSGRSVVVRGRPGVGVSALLDRAAQLATDLGLRVAAVRCGDYADGPVAVLQDLMDQLDAPVVDNGVVDRFVSTMSSLGGPVVLIVDDAHRAGPTSLAVLAEAADLPNVVVVAGAHGTTGDLTGLESTLVLDLAGLDRASVSAIVSRALDTDLDPGSALVASYARASGGNPLLLDALLDDPAITEALDRAASLDDPTSIVPQLVAALPAIVRQRVSTLPENVRNAVAVLAVAGDDVPTALLLELTEVAHLRTARDARLLVEHDDGTFAFRHRAVQRLVHQDLPRPRRLELHLALGRAAVNLGMSPGIAARHLLVSASLDPDAAMAVAQRAAAEATAAGAQAEGAGLLARAAEASQGALPRLAGS